MASRAFRIRFRNTCWIWSGSILSGGVSCTSVRISIFRKFLSYRTRLSVFSRMSRRLVGIFCRGIEPGKIAEVPHDPRDPVHMLVDGAERVLFKGRHVLGLEFLHQGRDGRQRVADLVGHAGGEPAHARMLGRPEQLLLDLFLLGDVLEHEHVPLLRSREPAQIALQDDLRIEVPPAGDLALMHVRVEKARLQAREQVLGLLGSGRRTFPRR